ncbi:type II secretion system F family protein [Mycobacterium sp. M1]|uniref:Type II secretion system F family protein n=1 Tax=Mycolicibacter acidiphilus TaxID=2835306 RepID=A0ABS5RI49_9MYCO|nr:type II secretion system F family protein [Mycolicibacter acidiphilus]MBS9533228.1 type II secretion system F family protein [Mycolicibacter acidiphilus]
MSSAVMLLALAVLVTGGPAASRARAGARSRQSPRRPVAADPDALALASSLEVFALCLNAGMPVSAAAAATARCAPPGLARTLRRGADLLALGADPAAVWGGLPADDRDPATAALLRLARRSGSSGTALAAGAADLAARCRADAADAVTAAAERAGVLIAGPLGVCFLPAFVCLGIVPVVAGLAGDVLRSGLL